MTTSSYKNGDMTVSIDLATGTRLIETSVVNGKPEFPYNVDIRTSTECSFGAGAKASVACSFCHESAKVNGSECDYNELLDILVQLPKGSEIAVGVNRLTSPMVEFLVGLKVLGFIASVTVNQGHLGRDRWIDNLELVYGFGVSYRKWAKPIPSEILNHSNTVVHVIAGIDDVDDVLQLKAKKVLVLGEKDFGFNSGKVNTKSELHKNWYRNLYKLFDTFEVVSFDNLALEQLNVRRFYKDSVWKTLYQGEKSLYIDGPARVFRRSSRGGPEESFDRTTIKEFFTKHCLE